MLSILSVFGAQLRYRFIYSVNVSQREGVKGERVNQPRTSR